MLATSLLPSPHFGAGVHEVMTRAANRLSVILKEANVSNEELVTASLDSSRVAGQLTAAHLSIR